jgi:hypothetical protein
MRRRSLFELQLPLGRLGGRRSSSRTPTPCSWFRGGGKGRPASYLKGRRQVGQRTPSRPSPETLAASPTPKPTLVVYTGGLPQRSTSSWSVAEVLLPHRSNLARLVEALSDLYLHVPASTVCLITLRHGVVDLVRVDTVEVLHVQH